MEREREREERERERERGGGGGGGTDSSIVSKACECSRDLETGMYQQPLDNTRPTLSHNVKVLLLSLSPQNQFCCWYL